MAFLEPVRQAVVDYVENHLPDDQFYEQYFWFVSDGNLRGRLEEEFRSARYMYKLLEGLQAKDWLLTAQVKVQILLYASIYEAVLHHVLLQDYSSTPEVSALTSYEHRRPISISGEIRKKIQDTYKPLGPISVYETATKPIDERKIVFEDKAETARALGLIDQSIKDVVCTVYSLRNAIHLHAEIRRGIAYEIDAAKDAYWHLKGFCQQIANKLVADGKAIAPAPPTAKSHARPTKAPNKPGLQAPAIDQPIPSPVTNNEQSWMARIRRMFGLA